MSSDRSVYVKCPSCPWRSKRVRRDDGTFGLCPTCHVAIVKEQTKLEKRLTHAREDYRRVNSSSSF